MQANKLEDFGDKPYLKIQIALGDDYIVDYRPYETLLELKHRIYDIIGVPVEQQTIIYWGKVIEGDSLTIKDHKIPKKVTIVLLIKQKKSKNAARQDDPRNNPETREHKERQKDPAQNSIFPDKKSKAFYKEERQRSESIFSSDSCNDSYHPQKPSIKATQPDAPMTITIQYMDGKEVQFKVTSLISIQAVKFEIEEREGIPFCDQNLTFRGRILDDSQTLSSYGIRNGSEVQCDALFKRKAGSIVITANTCDDEQGEVSIRANESVAKLKAELQKAMRIPVVGRKLIIKATGKVIQDAKTLSECGITTNCLVSIL